MNVKKVKFKNIHNVNRLKLVFRDLNVRPLSIRDLMFSFDLDEFKDYQRVMVMKKTVELEGIIQK